ncbi:metallophosphoesterase family protein [Corynebacterium sp. CCUG 69979]|uniref:metallophosphoesterase n=1 Tax=Corynebacterium sp. CCUG 69979 TaxID=2823890 RepID=UPI00210E075F|nr:metallophosphoesterase family protein [Corynebacterium sp. CCUG 69979]
MFTKSKYFKTIAIVSGSALFITACTAENENGENVAEETATATETDVEEVDPVYGEKNGLDLIELQDDKPEVAEVEVDNEPDRIAMNLMEDTSTEMGFNWYTKDDLDDSILLVSEQENMSDAMEFPAEATEVTNRYAERDQDGYFIYSAATFDDEGDMLVDDEGNPEEVEGYFTDEQIDRENTKWTADGSKLAHLSLVDVKEHSNKATATGLEPGKTYYFQVGSESEGYSETGTFTTSNPDEEGFQFIHYTDTQNAYWNEHVNNEAAYGANTLEKAMEVAPDANFALHTGDFVETAAVEDEWVDNLNASHDANIKLPHAYTPGNHDEYNLRWEEGVHETAFNEHTNVPVSNDKIDGGSYYSFDYSGAHFVVMNTNDNKESDDNPDEGAVGREQMEWAKEDIRKARENGANWIILAYHKPVYSASYHSLQDEDVQVTREEFVQMADELDVDLVLQGHDHNLTRTKSLTYSPDNFSYGEVEDTEKREIDGVEHHVNPDGVTYVIPNTSGTKTYDAIYQKGADHVHKVREKLDWMTEEDVDTWNDLFDVAEQPEKTPKFDHKHDNYRQSTIQSFAVYTVTEKEFKIDFYQVEGDLHNGEDREVKLYNSYGITKE